MKPGKKFLSLLLALITSMSCAVCLTFTASATYKPGDTLTFGSYPQTRVTDSSTIISLNSRSGNWISLTLYSGDGSWNTAYPRDFGKYCDVIYDGAKYRGLKFSAYRPDETIRAASTASEPGSLYNQYENGYLINNVYWFKYEPLKWRVLDPSTGLAICLNAIDSQAFSNQVNYQNNIYYNQNGSTRYYACDYTHSTLRTWLTGPFLNTAFSSGEQNELIAANIRNKGYYTLTGNVKHTDLDYADTTDKIFLPSYDEMIDGANGYQQTPDAEDPLRARQGTDYAKCMGLKICDDSGSYWWLRTAGKTSGDVCSVNSNGQSAWTGKTDACRTDFGIVPMICCSEVKFSPPDTVVVTLNADGGSVSPVTMTVTVDDVYGELPTPTREGYSFGGWYDGSEKITSSTTVTKTSDHTLTAKWSGDPVTVSLNANGGTLSTPTKAVTVGGIYGELPVPMRTGYIFQGWYEGSTQITASSTVKKTSDHTLTAKWQGMEITVTFDANGGTLSTPTKTVTVGGVYGELPTPARSNYTFLGWYTIGTGGARINSSTTVTASTDHTLYAHWQENTPPPTITIVNYSDTLKVDYKATVTFTAQTANAPAGAEVHWFIDGRDADTGTSCTRVKVSRSFSVQAKLMLGNTTLACSTVENVQVKTGFFAKLQAFFRGLFGKLPKIVQSYFSTDGMFF